MSTLSLHAATVATAISALLTLKHVLNKAAQTHPSPTALPSARLAPDMFPLRTQVQIVSNFGKQVITRLATAPSKAAVPEWKDIAEEATIEELIERIDKTVELLEGVDEADVAGAGEKIQELKLGEVTVDVSTAQYVFGYCLPNLFFHLSVAYGILRNQGVELGKKDYLGAFLRDVYPPKN